MRNVEIKAKVNDIKSLIERAKLLSGADGNVITQHDTFYNAPQGRLKLRRFQDDSAELIFYERPDMEGPKISSYEKANIAQENVDALHCVLDRALGSKGIVEKSRHIFLVGQTRIHIDSVENLGDFMELEVGLNPDQSFKEGEETALLLMQKLGIHKNDLICGAYTDLLSKE